MTELQSKAVEFLKTQNGFIFQAREIGQRIGVRATDVSRSLSNLYDGPSKPKQLGRSYPTTYHQQYAPPNFWWDEI